MNGCLIKTILWRLLLSLFIVMSSASFAACGEDVYEFRDPALLQSTGYDEGEFQAGASRMLSIHSSRGAADDGYEISLDGRLRASGASWIKNRCGPIVYWDFRGAVAEDYVVEFYEGFPLRTEADVDAFLAAALTKQTVEPNGENTLPAAVAQPSEPLWKFVFSEVKEPLAERIRRGEGAPVLAAFAYLAEQLEGDYMIAFAVNDLKKPMKAAEVLQYVNDFGDRMLYAYLKQHKPRCLAK